jgi:ribose/xylose/arabinose/galactoside ABC-type transport system permease subunit
MPKQSSALQQFVLRYAAILVFLVIFVIFSLFAPRFFTGDNVINILTNASYIGIVAVGITFVLLTGGIDLSVGSNMYLSGIVAGLLMQVHSFPIWLAIICALGVGFLIGAFNAFTITKLKVVPFVVTLGMLVAVRGGGLFLTNSKAVNFPESVTLMGATDVFGFLPLTVIIFLGVVLVAHIVLNYTQFGRHLYAVGNDEEAAEKAGINSQAVIAKAYMICGSLAALGGFVSVAQLGIINSGFGDGDELDAIAASILGGTSLFGGIGSVLPGTLLGTVMIQMIQAGLVFTKVDLYIQPLVMALVIFIAVYLDRVRGNELEKLQRRSIMKIES